jgi:HSP20 family protein
MSIIRWQPFTSALSNWPNVWDEEDWGSLTNTNNNLDLYETDDEVVVKANVAGVDSKDVDVMFEKGVLRIKAQKEEEQENKQRQHYSRSSWSYSYRVAIPGISMLDHSIEPEAVVEKGVVTITFKKAEASKPKKLQIKAK